LKIVANSSVLIALSSIGKLNLLRDKYKNIIIPKAVWSEVVETSWGEPGSDEVRKANWIEVLEIKDNNLFMAINESLDYGEAEAIVLAIELKADMILLDEKDARIIADRFNIVPLGTIGILIWAKKANKIESLKKELDKLKNEGNFRISPKVYHRALKAVDER